MSHANFLIAACTVASFSLSAQPSVDIILSTAPFYTENVSPMALQTTWTPPAGDDVWVLPPSGSKFLVASSTLAAEIAKEDEAGVYSLYFPNAGSGLRIDLIVE